MTPEIESLPLRFLRLMVIGALVSLTVVALWACAMVVADLAQPSSMDGFGLVIGLVVLVLDLPVILLAVSAVHRLGQASADGQRKGLLAASLLASAFCIVGLSGIATSPLVSVAVVMFGLSLAVALQHRPVASEAISQ